MPDRGVDILLIGGGIASATAAATLRDEGFEGSVLVVGRELDAPYHRPPATKGYLRGEEQPDWAEHLRLDVRRALEAGLKYVAKTGDTLLDPRSFGVAAHRRIAEA